MCQHSSTKLHTIFTEKHWDGPKGFFYLKGCRQNGKRLLFLLNCHGRITGFSDISVTDLLNYECRSKTIFKPCTLESWNEFAIIIKYALRSGEKWMIMNILYIGFHSVSEVWEYIPSYLLAVHQCLLTIQCYLLKCCLNKNVKML